MSVPVTGGNSSWVIPCLSAASSGGGRPGFCLFHRFPLHFRLRAAFGCPEPDSGAELQPDGMLVSRHPAAPAVLCRAPACLDVIHRFGHAGGMGAFPLSTDAGNVRILLRLKKKFNYYLSVPPGSPRWHDLANQPWLHPVSRCGNHRAGNPDCRL